MRRISVFVLLLMQTSLFTGCLLVDGGENSPRTRFDVEEDAFDALVLADDNPWITFDIPNRLENIGSSDVALTGCSVPGSALLQRLEDGKWITVFEEARFACFEVWRYGSGAVLHDTLNMLVELDPSSPMEPRWYSGPGIEGIPVRGTYRLERRVYDADGLERGNMTLLPLRQRVSREFEVYPVYNVTLATAPVDSGE